jgi:4-amino-4-deoxy-L-arabinose transferase-like glycosyltransferase
VSALRAWLSAHRVVAVVLVLLTIAGGVARGVVAAHPTKFQAADENAYARIAHSIAERHSFTPIGMTDPMRWGPGAPVAFAVAMRLDPGVSSDPHDVKAAYPWQAAFGTLLIPATFILGFLLAGEIAGIIAAAAIAAYPPLIDASGDLLTEPLGALMVALSLIAMLLVLRRPSWWRAVIAGVLFGLTVLVRVDLLAIPAIAVVVLAVTVWLRSGKRAAVLPTAAIIVGILIPLAPWSIFASGVKGQFVPVTSGGYSNLFIGTYLPGGGRLYGVKKELAPKAIKLHPKLKGQPYASVPQTLIFQAIEHEHPGLDENDALKEASKQNIRRYAIGQPVRFAGMLIEKSWRLWGWPTRGSGRTREGWMRLIHLPLVILATFGLIMALILRRGRDPGLWTMTLILAYVTATNAILVAEPRHNLPVMPVLTVAGAAGFVLAYQRWGRRPQTADPEPAGGTRQVETSTT